LARKLLDAGIPDQEFELWDQDWGARIWGPLKLSSVCGVTMEEGPSRPLRDEGTGTLRFCSVLVPTVRV